MVFRNPLTIPLSISVRLALWYGLSMVILLSILVVLLYSGFHVGLHRDFEEQMRRERAVLLPVVEGSRDRAALSATNTFRTGSYLLTGLGGTYVRLVGTDDRILFQSPNFRGQPVFRPVTPQIRKESIYSHTWGNVPARTLYTPLRSSFDGNGRWLEITRYEWSMHRDLHRLENLLAVVIILGVVVAMTSGYGLARRALRPVALITEAANRIHVHDLAARLPAPEGTNDELADLAMTFNAMLDRLQDSFERERRFRADAAHELFTPLSAIQSEAEVILRKPRDPDVYRQTIAVMLNHVQRMNKTVEGLLQLSRVERRVGVSVTNPVDISCVVLEQVQLFATRARERKVFIDATIQPHLFVRIDAAHMAAITGNLLDNAIKYTPSGGKIHVHLYSNDGVSIFSVSDTGIGFDEEQGGRLFDRFYRAATPSLDHPVPGTGLGLSIAQALVEMYAGTLQASSSGPGAGSTFEVRFSLDSGPHGGHE